MFNNGAEVKLIKKPNSSAIAIRVALNCVHRCSCEIPGSSRVLGKEDPGSSQSLNEESSEYGGLVLDHDTSVLGTDAEPTPSN